MKLLLLFTLALTSFSHFGSTYELDFSLDPRKVDDVFEVKLKSDFTDSRQVMLFVANYEDRLDKVLDNGVEVWKDGKDFGCDFVKVFYWDKKPEAAKLGLKVKKFSDVLGVYDRSVFFLKKDTKWSQVDKKDYYRFLRDRGFPNFAHKSFEKDENFPDKSPYKLVDVAERPSWADLMSGPKPLPKDAVSEKPRPVDVEVPVPEVGKVKKPEDENPSEVPKELKKDDDDDSSKKLEDDEDKDKVRTSEENSLPKKGENLKKEKSSFLTASLLLPAAMLTFYVTN